MTSPAADLARRLARNAEAVCRHYLSNGHREGRYWLVGDVANTPGRSLFVRLSGPDSGKGAAGKWTDAATGEHGDLLDLIALNRGLDRLRDALDEARSFLACRHDPYRSSGRIARPRRAARPNPHAGSTPCPGRSRARSPRTYLRGRGIAAVPDGDPLRFHPRCYYRPDERQSDRDLAGADRGRHRS